MGIFASIKNAIRGSAETGSAAARQPAPAASTGTPRADVQSAASPPPAPSPDPISQAAMEGRIASMPGAERLEWRTSIVDLMTLVGVDPSFANRKELADELGLEGYTGTAEQNIALHHAVVNMLAAEGGAMPQMLRD